MAIEVERKFLVENDGWRAAAEPGATISQFYVAAGADRSVRVRVWNGETARLALKFGGHSLARDEFEYDIALADARAMERFAIGGVIEKTRYRVPHGGHVYEVDLFKRELAGLVIAELETAEQVEDAALPGWVGREITGDPAFYNATLAMKGAA